MRHFGKIVKRPILQILFMNNLLVFNFRRLQRNESYLELVCHSYLSVSINDAWRWIDLTTSIPFKTNFTAIFVVHLMLAKYIFPFRTVMKPVFLFTAIEVSFNVNNSTSNYSLDYFIPWSG